MKKKGFTLIELLAVIVILAIIALIAMPLVLNTIEKAKEGAAKASAYAYAEEVERYIILSELDPTLPKLQTGVEYQLSSKKYEVAALADPTTTYINDLVSIKGDKPTEGYLKLNSEYRIEKMEMIIKSYLVVCENDECKIAGSKVEEEEKEEEIVVTGPTSEEPDETKTKGLIKIVYLDPTDLTKTCNASNSVSTTGTKSGCMKWYAYKDDGTNYTMILDHNTTPLVAWNSEETNTSMKELATALNNDKSTWKEELNARLITADEIAEITGANSNETLKWDSSKTYGTDDIETKVSWIYLDGSGTTYSNVDGWQKQVANATIKSKYAWLYNTGGCIEYGCNVEDSSNVGYWTSTPVTGFPTLAWFVDRLDTLSFNGVNYASYYGVRPVITISKTALD